MEEWRISYVSLFDCIIFLIYKLMNFKFAYRKTKSFEQNFVQCDYFLANFYDNRQLYNFKYIY